jgi:hypothetical protein
MFPEVMYIPSVDNPTAEREAAERPERVEILVLTTAVWDLRTVTEPAAMYASMRVREPKTNWGTPLTFVEVRVIPLWKTVAPSGVRKL